MQVKTIEEKLEFYKSILKENEECYVMYTNKDNKKTPIYVRKSESAESGFFELECELYKYTFTKGNAAEERFMREHGYIIVGNYAYDIQTPFIFFPFDKFMGEVNKVSKKDCVDFLNK